MYQIFYACVLYKKYMYIIYLARHLVLHVFQKDSFLFWYQVDFYRVQITNIRVREIQFRGIAAFVQPLGQKRYLR